MSGFDVVPFSDRWEEAHAEFARRNYPGKRRRADAGYLRWKFRGPASGEVPGLLIAVRGDEVIGQTGLLPGVLSVQGTRQPVQWICEMMVDPDHRRIGVTRALFAEGFGRGVISLAPGPSAVAHQAMARLGMGFLESSWVMVLPLRLGPVVSTRYPAAARADRVISLAGRPVVRAWNRRLSAGSRRAEAQVCGWRDVADLVADHEATFTAPHAVHDLEFLEWRCTGIDGWTRELDALRTSAGSFAIFDRDPNRLTVHQWRADSDDEAAAVFGRILYVAQSYGLNLVQAYAADAVEKARLEALAFRPRRTRTEMPVFPAAALDPADGDLRFTGYDADYLL